MEKISFITFTKNSEDKISGLLSQIRDVVDEIIVIDGFSDDETVKIAKKYNARVYLRKSWGFVEPDRMFALRMASYDWILYLDDDERISKRLKQDLKKLVISANKNINGYRVIRINLINKKPLLGPFYPDKQIRIFKKQKAIYKGLVHELPIIDGSIMDLPEDYYIIHKVNFSWKKELLYAYLESLMYEKYHAKNLFRIAIFHLAPLSTILLYLYFVGKSLYKRDPLNILGIIYAWNLAIYESILHILMHLRTKKEKLRAKLINKKGLIRLLKL